MTRSRKYTQYGDYTFNAPKRLPTPAGQSIEGYRSLLEMIQRLLPSFLCVQLILTFFFPPMALETKKIFAGDLWNALWFVVVVALAWRERRTHPLPPVKWLLHRFALPALLLLGFWAHGAWRPSLELAIKQGFFFSLADGDAFSPAREWVVAMRFLLWIWSSQLLVWVTESMKNGSSNYKQDFLRPIHLTAFWTQLVMGLFVLVELFMPSLLHSIQSIYTIHTDYEFWRGRCYGLFLSPVEAGLALALLTYWCMASPILNRTQKGMSIAIGILALISTKTATIGVAAGLSLLAIGFLPAWRWARRRPWWAAASAAGIAVLAFAMVSFKKTFLLLKVADFVFRWNLWKLYLTALFQTWHTALFGFGFVPYHTDNFFVFLLTRGGLIALFFAVGTMLRNRLRLWPNAPTRLRAIFLFLAFSALCFDVFIFRHVVAILLAMGVPTAISLFHYKRE